MIVTDCIEEYFFLMKKNPRLFAPSPWYPIVVDRDEIEAFERESGKKIGVLYKSEYHTLVVDLIKGEKGYFTYERMIPTAQGRGVVCVPVVNGKFLLLRQFRHPLRQMQLAFPRGFGEDGLAAEENARKELWEEAGTAAGECVFLGSITADSGLIGASCDVFLCLADSVGPENPEEGIAEAVLLSAGELEEKIQRGEISDSFTLSAYMLYKTIHR